MLEDKLGVAIGIGAKLKIRVIKDTIFKRLPVDSTELTSDKRQDMSAGVEITISRYNIQGNHCSFDSVDTRYLGHGYAFLEHVEIVGDKVEEKLLITAEQFYAIAPQTSLDKLEPLVAPLNIALAKYEINTPLRICHFLAQCCHESDQFNTTEEYASGDDYDDRDDLGNTPEIDGDGRLYKGRSFICVTGKANYQDLSDYVGLECVSNPELLASAEYAWLGACWFWDKHNLNNLADQDEFTLITRIINGGEMGIRDRFEALTRAKQAFAI